MDEYVEPKYVFLAITVDQGGNVVQACKRLGDLDLNYAKIRALGI